ncbi:MAG: alpha/beta hydrolase [Elusimicrobia bacterium]|nr:alpha/beta hydrolase [Elusimicrobiota bacterium]
MKKSFLFSAAVLAFLGLNLRAQDISFDSLYNGTAGINAIPAAAPAPSLAGREPVVITVSGLDFGEIGCGPFDVDHLRKLFNFFFPKKDYNDIDLVNAVVSFNKDRFLLENGEDNAGPDQHAARLPDNYLEAKIAETPEYAQNKITLVPFIWSRDPEDSAKAAQEFEQKLIEVHETYKNRPIHILAHSWGTVLIHETLHRVSLSHPEIKIERLITAGSPLVPGNAVVRLFRAIEINHAHFLKDVSKPANIGTWKNIWASRDPYSNAIPAADSNAQIDSDVENVEPALIDLILHNKALKKLAEHDLIKIRNFGDWHFSYILDYKASLESIHKDIFVPVFEPLIAPQVVEFADTQKTFSPKP